jgi:hypothetical protein
MRRVRLVLVRRPESLKLAGAAGPTLPRGTLCRIERSRESEEMSLRRYPPVQKPLEWGRVTPFSILFILEDQFAAIAAFHHMINRAT